MRTTLRNCICNSSDPFILFFDAHGHDAGHVSVYGAGDFDKNLLLLQMIVYFIKAIKENPNRALWANEITGLTLI